LTTHHFSSSISRITYTLSITMVGIARFAKKAGTSNATSSTKAAATVPNRNVNTTSDQASGSEASPSMDDDMGFFGDGNSQHDGGGRFDDDMSTMNDSHHGGGYADDFSMDTDVKFHHDAPSIGGNNAHYEDNFGMNEFDMPSQVDMARNDPTDSYDNQAKQSTSSAPPASEGLSRFAQSREGGAMGTTDGNDNRFSKTQQEGTRPSTGFSSKNDATISIKDGRIIPAGSTISRFSQAASATAQQQDGLAAFAEAAPNKYPIISKRRSEISQQQPSPHGQNVANRGPHGQGTVLDTKSFMGSNAFTTSPQDGRSMEARDKDDHFTKILPLPPRPTPGNAAARPPQEQRYRQPAMAHKPTNSTQRPLTLEQQAQGNVGRSAASCSGTGRFVNAPMPKATAGQPQRREEQQDHYRRQVLPTPPSNRPQTTAVTPFVPPNKAGGTRPNSSMETTNAGDSHDSREFSGPTAESTQNSIDMGYDKNEFIDENESQESRRVSFEGPVKGREMYRLTVEMQDDEERFEDQYEEEPMEHNHQKQLPPQGRGRATRRHSIVRPDPRRVSIETPNEEYGRFDSPMEESYEEQEGQDYQSTVEVGMNYQDGEQPIDGEWTSETDTEHPMEEDDGEAMMYDPSLLTFEGQSQAFTEAHEKTEDLQSEICADLRKMNVKFYMDLPVLLGQCDELLELLDNCEDLELQADNAIARFQTVMSTVLAEGDEEDDDEMKEAEPEEIEMEMEEETLTESATSKFPAMGEDAFQKDAKNIEAMETEVNENEKAMPSAPESAVQMAAPESP
jgi:hypothetical protein